MRTSDLKKVLQEIKEYCEWRECCAGCPLQHLDGGICFLEDFPEYWQIEEIPESLIESDDWRQED